LVAGGTEVTTLARKSQKILMAAFCTSDPGEPVTQNPAVQVAVNDGPKIGTIKPIALSNRSS
jgi:hypothetical protein